jgi:hypothetical protein
MESIVQPADTQGVKRILLGLLILLVPLASASAWRILYAEQYYKLYHEHLYHYPDDTMEDIAYLKAALNAEFAPFANPLYALATIRTTAEWERYRYLFYLHVNLKLVYSYLTLASKWDKRNAYFYNYPWKQQNLESLDTAESLYRQASPFWEKAKEWSAKAWALRSISLEQIEQWQDECFRIQTGDLDYRAIIDTQLARVAKVRADFQKMDQTTY